MTNGAWELIQKEAIYINLRYLSSDRPFSVRSLTENEVLWQ
jgi:hypothetical protein